MTFNQILTRLMESHPTWGRRMCVLAARMYLGIDDIRQYEQGIMVTMRGEPLLSHSELRQVASAWWPMRQRTLRPAWDFPASCREEKLQRVAA